MRTSILYRIAAVLILLFAIGHTLGFQKTDPKWGVDASLDSLRSIRFETQGFTRNYLDFFVGFGLFASVFLIFAAVLAWQLGGLSPQTLSSLRGCAWSLAACFLFLTFLCWRYFFAAPVIFSAIITVVLTTAASLISRPHS